MRPVFILLLLATPLSAQQLYDAPEGVATRWSTFENPRMERGGGGKSNQGAKGRAFDVIAPGQSMDLLNDTGAGIITRIWLTVDDRSPVMLRSVRLEMYWDNTTEPAVSAPLGDFFGVGLGRKTAFESALFSDPEGRSFNCFIPMPYTRAARVVMINEYSRPVTLFYEIDVLRLQKHPKKPLYFHCYWNREDRTKLGKDFTILPSVSGKGRFLGMNVGIIADSIYGRSWWGEGEVKIFLDEDREFATLVGTGTEDYIGTAWGQGAFAHSYQGCTIADEKNRQWCFYRYHIPDPVFFSSGIKVTIQQIGGEGTDYVRDLLKKGAPLKPVSVAGEKFTRLLDLAPTPAITDPAFPQGWTNYYRQDDLSATAYFYLDRPVNGLPKIAGTAYRTHGLLRK